LNYLFYTDVKFLENKYDSLSIFAKTLWLDIGLAVAMGLLVHSITTDRIHDVVSLKYGVNPIKFFQES